MKIAYLVYERSFSLEDIYFLLNGKSFELGELAIELAITNNLDQLGIREIYLPVLEINSQDIAKISTESLKGLPLRINKNITSGFSVETLDWLKDNIIFKDLPHSVNLEQKLIYNGVQLWVMELVNSEKMGRGVDEHLDSKMLKIEVSLDNMNPEFYGYIVEKLFKLEVNDVYIEQVIMKKNRPGQILNILCQEEKSEKIIDFIFRETTTLGIRFTPYTVYRLEREFTPIETEWGIVNLKVGRFKGEIVQIAPEYDDCIRIAAEFSVPVKVVYDYVKAKGYEQIKERKFS